MVARLISACSVFMVAVIGGILTFLPAHEKSNSEKHFMHMF